MLSHPVTVHKGLVARRRARDRVVRCHAQFVRTEGKDNVVARLQALGITVPSSCTQRNPEFTSVPSVEVEPMLELLQSHGLQATDIELMLLRCPRLFTYNVQRQAVPVVEFLQKELGFDQQQVVSTIKRFPHLLGYQVKAHLAPHLHYLKSLGISDEQLPQLILARPHVLGTSIELVITYLRKWLRIERTNVGRLLWTYPFDYSLPRLVLPNKGPSVTESWEDTASSTSGSSEGQASAGQTAVTAEETARSSSQQQNPDEQLEKPPLGSPDRCTWLELPSQKKDRDSTADGNPDD